ncbi:hypothetical protein B0F90DRAFT_208912 [Multifurca ochricompacta]|uniref:Uncharacterized protein n=1 Tax=Multifurca ochricompacta TaxID=376703 RepID=A0AAD4QP65_9AGAM|nr:hypothetical protein B0F90DRAFT_208912 [Multifurca ochricompacta]
MEWEDSELVLKWGVRRGKSASCVLAPRTLLVTTAVIGDMLGMGGLITSQPVWIPGRCYLCSTQLSWINRTVRLNLGSPKRAANTQNTKLRTLEMGPLTVRDPLWQLLFAHHPQRSYTIPNCLRPRKNFSHIVSLLFLKEEPEHSCTTLPACPYIAKMSVHWIVGTHLGGYIRCSYHGQPCPGLTLHEEGRLED